MKNDRVPDALKEQWASIRETMAELAVSRSTVLRLIEADKLTTTKYLGDRVLVSRASIKEFLATFVEEVV